MKLEPHQLFAALAAVIVTLTLFERVAALGEPYPDHWLARRACRRLSDADAREACLQGRTFAGQPALPAGLALSTDRGT
jgi:hypothetical protein